MILTLDIGTSFTKAGLWSPSGLHSSARSPLSTRHPRAGWVEQDAAQWWPSVVDACAACFARGSAGQVDAVVLSGARQTFVPVTSQGEPLRPALVWSDKRAGAEASELARRCGGAEEVWRRTGMVLDGAAPAAKLDWLARHEPDVLWRSAFVASPRDLVVHRLTGSVVTDTTLASASGMYDAGGELVTELAASAEGRLAVPVDPTTVVGSALPEAAAALGLAQGVPVVVGAGDRPCEVLGSGAGPDRPMVAWGTTANVSTALPERPGSPPPGLVLTRGALGGWLVEGGLSAAGSLLAWLGSLTGQPVDEFVCQAADVGAGAGGVLAFPWLGGARAPWWEPDASAGFVGLGADHGPPHLARAAVEAVAFDVKRCLEAMAGTPGELAIGGSAGTDQLWLEVLTAVTGLRAVRRRSGEASMAGAVLVACRAVALDWALDDFDPVASVVEADPALVDRYAALRHDADATAMALLRRPGGHV